jgi:hypothetical protein
MCKSEMFVTLGHTNCNTSSVSTNTMPYKYNVKCYNKIQATINILNTFFLLLTCILFTASQVRAHTKYLPAYFLYYFSPLV